ncbi:MAG TPA: hypothetical protein VIK01_02000 [Polyangiaceae bacterium]
MPRSANSASANPTSARPPASLQPHPPLLELDLDAPVLSGNLSR